MEVSLGGTLLQGHTIHPSIYIYLSIHPKLWRSPSGNSSTGSHYPSIYLYISIHPPKIVKDSLFYNILYIYLSIYLPKILSISIFWCFQGTQTRRKVDIFYIFSSTQSCGGLPRGTLLQGRTIHPSIYIYLSIHPRLLRTPSENSSTPYFIFLSLPQDHTINLPIYFCSTRSLYFAEKLYNDFLNAIFSKLHLSPHVIRKTNISFSLGPTSTTTSGPLSRSKASTRPSSWTCCPTACSSSWSKTFTQPTWRN